MPSRNGNRLSWVPLCICISAELDFIDFGFVGICGSFGTGNANHHPDLLELGVRAVECLVYVLVY